MVEKIIAFIAHHGKMAEPCSLVYDAKAVARAIFKALLRGSSNPGDGRLVEAPDEHVDARSAAEPADVLVEQVDVEKVAARALRSLHGKQE